LNDEQSLAIEVNWQRLLMVGVAIAAVVTATILGIRYWHFADPYVQSVMAREGNVDRGHSIFQLNCAGCHGTTADGRVGPSLRGVSSRRAQWSLIKQITSGQTPPMPKFQVAPEVMADLLSYLKTL
jgi:mono/diheme cytochrome c family protein